MTKPVSALTQFQNNYPFANLVSLDNNFTALFASINDALTYSNYAADTSAAANTVTISFAAGLTVAYTVGLRVEFKCLNTNTTGVQINVNSLGNKTLLNPDGSTMSPGQLVAGGIYIAEFDGTNFQLLGSFVNPANAKTAAETAAGVTPINLSYAPGVVDRYGTNTTPGTTDMTTAFQAALNQAAQSTGAVVQLLSSTYLTSSTLTISPNTTIQGVGRKNSTIKYTGTGDGIKSTSPINSSTAVHIEIRDVGITCSNGSNTGGGYVDIGGTYWTLRNVFFSGFKFGVICDQSEIVAIRDGEFIVPAIANAAGVWLVNGADHTVGANPLFTNRITIDNCQFNAATGVTNYGIVDDGGSNHTVSNCNINAPAFGMRFASVFGLTVSDIESEGCPSVDIVLDETTAGIGLIAAGYQSPVVGFTMTGNAWLSNGISHNLRLTSARNGDIRGNLFGQASGSCISFFGGAGNPCSGIVIEANEKLITGAGRTAVPFISASSLAIQRANKLRQVPVTYVSSALGLTGSQTITPQTMENIHIGSRLFVRSADGSNSEQVYVTAVTGSTFTATFASTKGANWLVAGITEWDEEEGTWTPVLAGSTVAGSNSYASDTVGRWQRRGNLVQIQGTVDVSTKDGAMSGALKITGLPFQCSNITNQNAANLVTFFDGFTFAAGYTQLGGFIAPGQTAIQLRKSGSAVALTTVPATDIPGTTCLISFSAVYATDSA